MEKLKVGSKFICTYNGENRRYLHLLGTVGQGHWEAGAEPPGWVYGITFDKIDHAPEQLHEDWIVPVPNNTTKNQIKALRNICNFPEQKD